MHGDGDPLLDHAPRPVDDLVRMVTRIAARSWPVSYHLLPSQEYFNRVSSPVFVFQPKGFLGRTNPDITAWNGRYAGSISSFSRMKEFLLPGNPTRERPDTDDLDTPEVLRPKLFSDAESDHSDILPFGPDRFSEPLPIYQVVGWGMPTALGIRYKPTITGGIGHRSIDTCAGDGTVV